MHSRVHPLVVILVMLMSVLAVGVWMWGTGSAKTIGGPAALRQGPDGHLYLQIQNQLLEHDADGNFVVRHDLSRLGVHEMLGGFAFFSDGDILLRRGPDPRTFLDNIRAYQRKTNDQSLRPKTQDAGLYRCNLEDATCTRFGSPGIDFKAAHSVFIDWQTDDVYITDTTRHLLRKYAADGRALAAPAAGFRFPNQSLLHEGQLVVANTNRHEIRIVDPRSDRFGEELKVIDVVPRAAADRGQTWPSHLARVGDGWWVNNMRAGMNDGGIYVFDDDWSFRRRARLPDGADPISLLGFGGEVLVSDWNNDKVYRLSREGELLRDFDSPGLQQVLAESRAKRREYELYGYLGIVLFVVVMAGLLVRALAVSLSGDAPGRARGAISGAQGGSG